MSESIILLGIGANSGGLTAFITTGLQVTAPVVARGGGRIQPPPLFRPLREREPVVVRLSASLVAQLVVLLDAEMSGTVFLSAERLVFLPLDMEAEAIVWKGMEVMGTLSLSMEGQAAPVLWMLRSDMEELEALRLLGMFP